MKRRRGEDLPSLREPAAGRRLHIALHANAYTYHVSFRRSPAAARPITDRIVDNIFVWPGRSAYRVVETATVGAGKRERRTITIFVRYTFGRPLLHNIVTMYGTAVRAPLGWATGRVPVPPVKARNGRTPKAAPRDASSAVAGPAAYDGPRRVPSDDRSRRDLDDRQRPGADPHR